MSNSPPDKNHLNGYKRKSPDSSVNLNGCKRKWPDLSVNLNGCKRKSPDSSIKNNGQIKQRISSESFNFGNYNRYYGYRNINCSGDPRIEVFNKRKELFVDKDILDIGCNIGHVTYTIARDFSAKSILGVDIDNSLIQVARKNQRFYCNKPSPDVAHLLKDVNLDDKSITSIQNRSNSFAFPDNVTFLHSNYVLYSDDLLRREEPTYDVILCLSVTKWIHLNWGDDGIKRTFQRIFIQLRSGGVFIMEAQPLESYKKKKISARLRKNCQDIRFFPHMFEQYLLSEVGFTRTETLEIPSHSVKGFQRPINLFFKS